MASLFIGDRSEIFDIVSEQNCNDAQGVMAANDYDALFIMLQEHIEKFGCYDSYLNDILDAIDDAILVSYGVYYNKNLEVFTNPNIVVNCTDCDINIDASGPDRLAIIQGSIGNLLITGNKTLEYLLVAGGAIIVNLTIGFPGDTSNIKAVSLKSCGKYPSKITTFNTAILPETFTKEPLTVFDGYVCNPIIPV